MKLSWFKNELAELRIEEQRIKNKILEQKLKKEDKKEVERSYPFVWAPEGSTISTTYNQPFLSIKLVNDVLIVVLHDGTVLTKSGATKEDFSAVSLAKNLSEVLSVISLPEIVIEKQQREVEIEKIKNIQKGLEVLNTLDDFDVVDNTVYLKGTNRSVPELLVDKFLSLFEKYSGLDISRTNEYQALKNFFLWCCLNPRVEVADKLYDFLQKNSFRITKQGFFVALRNVVTVHTENEEDRKLVDFVSNSYNKIKAVWKQKPSNFRVVKDDDDNLCIEIVKLQFLGENKHIVIGNLDDLYKDLPNMLGNRYTDAHTGTFDIRVGKVVSMPMSEANWSLADCNTGGLHFTSDNINYVGCGDTSVLVLINPMKVVGIGEQKGRCYEYLPIMTVPADEATEILHDVDFDTLELDEDYAITCLESLSEKVKGGFTAETTKYSFNLPQISTEEIQGIVASLEKMKESLSKRVSVI